MDVWVQGWGLIALWVTAVAAVLTLCFVWAIWVKVDQAVRVLAPKGPRVSRATEMAAALDVAKPEAQA